MRGLPVDALGDEPAADEVLPPADGFKGPAGAEEVEVGERGGLAVSGVITASELSWIALYDPVLANREATTSTKCCRTAGGGVCVSPKRTSA